MLTALQNRKRKGFTLIELLVVVAIIALLISILLPSLTQAKAMARTVLCGSHLKACFAGWTNYANDFEGKYIAMWDRVAWNKIEGYDVAGQAPYTMWYYFKGISLPGRVRKNGAWYNPEALAYGGFSVMSDQDIKGQNPAYHCTELEDKVGTIYQTPFNSALTSYSLFFPRTYNSGTDRWESDMDWYGTPDLYTHPGSTGLQMCLSRDGYASTTYNAWCGYDAIPVDPHGGKSNYLFADGHVDTLQVGATDETMWTPMWEMK